MTGDDTTKQRGKERPMIMHTCDDGHAMLGPRSKVEHAHFLYVSLTLPCAQDSSVLYVASDLGSGSRASVFWGLNTTVPQACLFLG